eukprot:4104623-Pyramimonas_sp.AAC.1
MACFNFVALALKDLADEWPSADDVPKVARGFFQILKGPAEARSFLQLRTKYMFILLKEVRDILMEKDPACEALKVVKVVVEEVDGEEIRYRK